MAKIYLMFFSGKSLYGRIIKVLTLCKWSHVTIAFKEGQKFISYEALTNKGLVKREYSEKLVKKWIKEETLTIRQISIDTPACRVKEVCENKFLGSPYDWISIINIAFLIFFGKPLVKRFGAKVLICSEFVSRVLYKVSSGEINLAKEYGKEFDLVTPAEVFRSKQIIYRSLED